MIYLLSPGVCIAHFITCILDEYFSVSFMHTFYTLSILFTVLLTLSVIGIWTWWALVLFICSTLCGANFIRNCI